MWVEANGRRSTALRDGPPGGGRARRSSWRTFARLRGRGATRGRRRARSCARACLSRALAGGGGARSGARAARRDHSLVAGRSPGRARGRRAGSRMCSGFPGVGLIDDLFAGQRARLSRSGARRPARARRSRAARVRRARRRAVLESSSPSRSARHGRRGTGVSARTVRLPGVARFDEESLEARLRWEADGLG